MGSTGAMALTTSPGDDRGPVAAHSFAIQMLRAAHGDALVVTWGQPAHRLLIDGGPAHRYDEEVRPWAEGLDRSERHLELLCVSHVDTDHIDGALILLQELDELGLTIDDVWFNGWDHVIGTRGGVQGEFLAALLSRRKWNGAFRGRAVKLSDRAGAPLPVVRRRGATFTLLSPDRSKLTKLRDEWEQAVTQAGLVPGDAARSLAALDDRRWKRYVPPVTRGVPGNDNAPANGSAIAFVFEHGGRRALFGADAHADRLTASVQQLAHQTHQARLAVDVVKLPHHGSINNVSPELLRALDCRTFLISTNGAIFQHPDPETLALLADEVGECTVIFNYDNPVVRRWERVLSPVQRRRIRAVYPNGDEPTVLDV